MIKPYILVVGPFEPKNILITFNEKSNMQSTKELDQLVKKLWKEKYEEAVKQGKKIYNGQSYRLNSFKVNSNRLIMEVSLIPFDKRFPLSTLFRQGLIDFPEEYYSKGLGIGGLVETSDTRYVFGKRSGKTMTHTSIDFIGGIIEGIKLKDGTDLYDLNIKEIQEEIGVPESNILDYKILGLIQSDTGTVIIITHTKLTLSSSEVKEFFENEGDDEMSCLEFVDTTNLQKYLFDLGGYKPAVVDLLSKTKE